MKTCTQSRSDAEVQLEEYLRQQASDGEIYVKSKFIAADVDLSPSEIGTLLSRLQGSSQDLRIEKWAYSNATTWRITTRNDTQGEFDENQPTA